jgi:hypothetical protein
MKDKPRNMTIVTNVKPSKLQIISSKNDDHFGQVMSEDNVMNMLEKKRVIVFG